MRGRGLPRPAGCLELQHHAAWGGPHARARLMQANTSKPNVRLSNSALSTYGVLSFLRSFLAVASSSVLASSAPV
ncbi:hypothetical protein D7W79_07635 [Corallococcus exercitus]|nr:hypothetical protein D7W79_07635 [Corallococcus exercitus]